MAADTPLTSTTTPLMEVRLQQNIAVTANGVSLTMTQRPRALRGRLLMEGEEKREREVTGGLRWCIIGEYLVTQ